MGAFHRRVFQDRWASIKAAIISDGSAPPSFVHSHGEGSSTLAANCTSHEPTADGEFDEYNTPAGICFLINALELAKQFDHSNDFLPERWIDGTKRIDIANFWGFGGDRRICVGWRVAQQALFLASAHILYCFDSAPVRTLHL
ncbi:hypothetical protein F4776DRAFT_673263 [Hypoxylon sp. NC0597]|nr:hypothetical protein F4776DRAFT_673263 [Hypoxylon sp. NC0597]